MRVNRLYVFGAVGHDKLLDEETSGGCEALAQRSAMKCGNVVLQLTGQPRVDVQAEGEVPGAPTGVGAYLVCHGNAGEPNWNGSELSDAIGLMRETMGEDDFRALTKVAVLACGAAPQASSMKLGRVKGNNGDPIDFGQVKRRGLLKFMFYLRDNGCCPMVAGYDDFVSVAYPGTKHDHKLPIEPGQKFISRLKKPYISRKDGDSKERKSKRFFQLKDGGKVILVKEAGWSDKI